MQCNLYISLHWELEVNVYLCVHRPQPAKTEWSDGLEPYESTLIGF